VTSILDLEYPKHTTNITDEAIAELKGLIGEEVRIPAENWRIEDSKYGIGDIKVLCRAIGDFSPLFFDPEYAKATKHGRQVVPPSIIAEMLQIDPGREILRGARAVLKAALLEWEVPILEGDAIVGTSWLRTVEETTSPHINGRVVRQEYDTTIINHRGQGIGSTKHVLECYERGSEAEAALFADREPFTYNREMMEAIHQEYRGEEEARIIRGGEPRDWAEVKIGERIPPILKGPTTMPRRVDSRLHLGYSGGLSRWYDGLEDMWELPERWPELFLINEHGTPEPLETIELTHVRSKRFLKLPTKEANSERIHWTAQLITNWIGDSGCLKRLNLRFPKINVMGDITRCYGRVTGKRCDHSEHLLQVEVWNINQVGDVVTTGTVDVILP